MNTIELQDEHGQRLALVKVDLMTEALIQGRIAEQHFTPQMLRMFEAFQAMVEHQMFGYLDQFEQHTAALNLRVVIGDMHTPIYDLQVYDLKQISFRLETNEEDDR